MSEGTFVVRPYEALPFYNCLIPRVTRLALIGFDDCVEYREDG